MSLQFDFTLNQYAALCEAIIESGYPTATIADYLRQPEQFERVVVLRHDVDRLPWHALYMAQQEHELGLRSTYYVRTTPSVFRPKLLLKIAAMGHEIGYHYETLATTSGDFAQAYELFMAELAQLRHYVNISTIAMHGSPLSPYDNRTLWEQYDYRQHDLLGEAYLDIDYTQIGYLTDTGRSWGATTTNRRDRPLEHNALRLPPVHSTAEVIALLRSQQVPRLILQAHPERWAWSYGTLAYSWGWDTLANSVKWLLAHMRR